MKNTENFSCKIKKPAFLIGLSLVLILVGSIFATMINTSFYKTSISKVTIDTKRGELSGLLYKPKDANSKDPRPAIIATHGYLNTKEIHDAEAIELSRRGYTVLLIDMYDHGLSTYKLPVKDKTFFSFWPESIHDAVEYIYKQDYVLKDENGNGIIAVTGDDQEHVANSDGNKFYQLPEGGKRVIYTPNDLHPWNHFSKETTKNIIDFYSLAFEEYTSTNQGLGSLDSDNQIWWLKEAFEFVALTSFFLMFIPLIMLLLNIPLFAKAKQPRCPKFKDPRTLGQHFTYWMIISFLTLFPGYIFPVLIKEETQGIKKLIIGTYIVILLAIIAFIKGWILHFVKNKKSILGRKKAYKTTIGSILVVIASLILRNLLVNRDSIIPTIKYFDENTTNLMVYWALVVSAATLIILLISYHMDKKNSGVKINQYGYTASFGHVLTSLLLAIVVVVFGYCILFIVNCVFKTDFRIWTFAVKTFNWSHVMAFLKYIPLFFIYYFINGVVINVNTNSKRMKGWKGYLVALSINVGGLILYFGYHYGKGFLNGTLGYQGEGLSSILLFSLIPTLIVATIFTKFLYKKTGSVYLGAFLNTILITMITVSNTITQVNFY